MTDFPPEYLAKEAERLMKEPVLLHAIQEMKNEALEALVSADPDDKTAILREQQRHIAAEEILTVMQRFITAVSDAGAGFGVPA